MTCPSLTEIGMQESVDAHQSKLASSPTEFQSDEYQYGYNLESAGRRIYSLD